MKRWIEPWRISVFIVTTPKSKSLKNPRPACLDEFVERRACVRVCARAALVRSALAVRAIAPSGREARPREMTSRVRKSGLRASLAVSARRVPRVNSQLRGINSL